MIEEGLVAEARAPAGGAVEAAIGRATGGKDRGGPACQTVVATALAHHKAWRCFPQDKCKSLEGMGSRWSLSKPACTKPLLSRGPWGTNDKYCGVRMQVETKENYHAPAPFHWHARAVALFCPFETPVSLGCAHSIKSQNRGERCPVSGHKLLYKTFGFFWSGLDSSLVSIGVPHHSRAV